MNFLMKQIIRSLLSNRGPKYMSVQCLTLLLALLSTGMIGNYSAELPSFSIMSYVYIY
jgi:hypothetical protein